MVVHEGQSGILQTGGSDCTCQIPRFEAHISMQMTFVIVRCKDIEYDSRFSHSPGGGTPESKAKVFLQLPCTDVAKEKVASLVMHLLGQNCIVRQIWLQNLIMCRLTKVFMFFSEVGRVSQKSLGGTLNPDHLALL